MKRIVFILGVLLITNTTFGQKLLSPIKFFMTQKELKEVVRADQDKRLLTGQLHLTILADRYWGVPAYSNGQFVSIELSHYAGTMNSSNFSFGKYDVNEFKRDIETLVQYFNQLYGNPTEYIGFLGIDQLESGMKKRIATWQTEVEYVQIWEEYVNRVAYPVILICEKGEVEKAKQKIMNDNPIDQKYGFRDYKFETDISQFPNIILAGAIKDSLVKYYIDPSEKLTVGQYELEEIIYGFYRGSFFSVQYTTKGYSNSRGLLSALNQLYGPGNQSNKYLENYMWEGNLVRAIYEESSITHDALVLIACKKYLDRIRKDGEEAAKKAANDL